MPHHDYWRDEPDDPKLNETRMIKAIHKIHTHVGYNYPGCTMDELNKLHAQQDLPYNLLMKWKLSNMDRATANLEEFLAKPPGQQESMVIARLKNAWNDTNWTPDVAIKCWNDINRAWFGEQMKDRVMVCWRESEKTFRHDSGPSYQHVLGFTTGGTYTGPPPTVLIQLNAKLIFCSPTPAHNGVRQTFGTLLHECVHGG
ncbi:hypothetical protein MMC30_003212 [Trapelia coarctata]|nr:hypothetical protein [Trapelia coarctata]